MKMKRQEHYRCFVFTVTKYYTYKGCYEYHKKCAKIQLGRSITRDNHKKG